MIEPCVPKTKTLFSCAADLHCAVTAQLICVFVFECGSALKYFKKDVGKLYILHRDKVTAVSIRLPITAHYFGHMSCDVASICTVRNLLASEVYRVLVLEFQFKHYLSRLVGKPTMWFQNRSNTNRPVQAQKRGRSLKFRI